jgi:hypothetical protein
MGISNFQPFDEPVKKPIEEFVSLTGERGRSLPPHRPVNFRLLRHFSHWQGIGDTATKKAPRT